MQIGFNLPISGPMSTPEIMARVAQEGEKLGYDYFTLTDHVLLPDTNVPGYPYSESGSFYSDGPENRHEQLTTAAFLAAKTSRIRIVLAVLVVPHRPAVLAAKMLSTIDVLSGGRLVVGIGAGWLKAEFDSVVTTPFAERGAVTDEYLDAFRTLWTQRSPQFDGRYVQVKGMVMEPKPVQKPYPPIWIGGESPPALRRTARIGDAWYPIGSNNAHLLDSLPRYRAGVARLRKLTEQAGRDPASVALVYRVKRFGAEVPPLASDGERRLFSGSAAEIIGDIRSLQEIGVSAFDFDFERADADDSIAEMKRFKDEILSKV